MAMQEPEARTPSSLSGIRGILAAILVLMILYTFWAAASLIIPLIIAILLYLVLSPIVDRLVRFAIPRIVATLLVFGIAFSVLVGGGALLSEPATEWVERAPRTFDQLRFKVRGLIQPLKELDKASEQVASMTDNGDSEVQQVVVKDNAIQTVLFSGTGKLLAGLAIVLILTAFMLAVEGRFERDLARLLPTREMRFRAFRISRDVKRELSYFLLTITLINAGLGIGVGIAMYLIGMPNPVLWGAVAGLFNFIPVLGPAAAIAIVFLVSLVTFATPAEALVPPLVIFGFNVVESQLVTPAILALRLSLSPIFVIVSLIVWGWLWGAAGVLLAVPLLAVGKIICDHVPSLQPLGVVLGARRDPVVEGARVEFTRRLRGLLRMAR